MTFWTHLTRDHQFVPLLIKGLTEAEQAKLHARSSFRLLIDCERPPSHLFCISRGRDGLLPSLPFGLSGKWWVAPIALVYRL